MRTVSILESNDVVKSGDWCRPLSLVTMSGGMSDDYSFESCYNGTPENNVKWTTVDRILDINGIWKKHTVEQLCNISEYSPLMEFVRGDIPRKHQLCFTLSEYSKVYELYLDINVAPRGKYAGNTWKDIRKKHNSYFEWATGNGFCPTKDQLHREYVDEFYGYDL